VHSHGAAVVTEALLGEVLPWNRFEALGSARRVRRFHRSTPVEHNRIKSKVGFPDALTEPPRSFLPGFLYLARLLPVFHKTGRKDLPGLTANLVSALLLSRHPCRSESQQIPLIIWVRRVVHVLGSWKRGNP